jgi:Na+:H+ antiporter, NhaA family
MSTPNATEVATPIERIVRPFHEFTKLESSGGILLIGCTILALVWANSPWAETYAHLWHTPLTFGLGDAAFSKPLHFWINDGLMAVFFLLVGLEIKREVLVGELASVRQAVLPIAAALGGMLVPAGLYALFNRNGTGSSGWGIPMATDIAFALGLLAILGKRVPLALKVFLAAVAIADDIGAVLVIAVFYTATISWLALGIGAAFFAALVAMNRAGARHPFVYTVLGFGLWAAFVQSGVHATVAGVLLAMTIPARQRIDGAAFVARSSGILDEIRRISAGGETMLTSAAKQSAVQTLENYCEQVETPMQRIEHALVPWVKNLVMPVFALANAGVVLGSGIGDVLADPINLGIVCGLVLGKPIGIVLFAWLAVVTGLAAFPAGIKGTQILGAGILAGVGFTMSLFIAGLAFGPTPTLETAKTGILAASLVAGTIGGAVLWIVGKPVTKNPSAAA